MLMLNALDEALSVEGFARALSQGYNLDTVTPVSVPEIEIETFEFNSANTTNGNAVFNVEWTGGEYFVGKELNLTYLITDTDGFDPSSVTIKWYEFNEAGSYTPSTPLGTGSSYTITNNEVGSFIGFEISFTDDASIEESLITFHRIDVDGDSTNDAVRSTATVQPNTERNVFSYPELETHLTNNGMSSNELSIRLRGNSNQSF